MSRGAESQKLGKMLAQIRQAIDTYLNSAVKATDPEEEGYGELNWENRTGSKGQFQMIRRDSCNDTQLFSHLETVLKQNKGNLSLGDYHYWAGDEGYIFRRRKTRPTEEDEQ